MTWNPSTTPAVPAAKQTARRERPRFTFAGALDEVPPDIASTLAELTSMLLRHGDRHGGRGETVRLTRESDEVNLWVDDPECSIACLELTGQLPAITAATGAPPAAAQLEMRDGDGLSLHWRLALPDAVAAYRATG
ncbi:hypothetical protein [Nocardioides ultimimeridianus]